METTRENVCTFFRKTTVKAVHKYPFRGLFALINNRYRHAHFNLIKLQNERRSAAICITK